MPRQRNTLKHFLLVHPPSPPPLHSSVTCYCLSDRVAANPVHPAQLSTSSRGYQIETNSRTHKHPSHYGQKRVERGRMSSCSETPTVKVLPDEQSCENYFIRLFQILNIKLEHNFYITSYLLWAELYTKAHFPFRWNRLGAAG